MSTPQPAPRLSTAERHQLDDCETIIRHGIEDWRDVGEALSIIRDRGLFRETHLSFDAYARDKWKLGKSRAYQLVAAVAYAKEEEAEGRVVPQNEHQARQAMAGRKGPQATVTPESLARRIARTHTPVFVRTLIVRLQEALH